MRPDAGITAKSPSYLHIPSIASAQGYSSSDHSSQSRTQHSGDSNEIQVFHPSAASLTPPQHQTNPPIHHKPHPRSNTLPTIPTDRYSCNHALDHQPLSAISDKRRTRNKNTRKKKTKQSKKASRKPKNHSKRRHNTETLPTTTPKLAASDTEIFGGPKPYFVVRTPVTAGPFSPYPTATHHDPKSSPDSPDGLFPDTQWYPPTPESPVLHDESPPKYHLDDGYKNPYSPRHGEPPPRTSVSEKQRSRTVQSLSSSSHRRKHEHTKRKVKVKVQQHRTRPQTARRSRDMRRDRDRRQSTKPKRSRAHHRAHQSHGRLKSDTLHKHHNTHYKSQTMTHSPRNTATQYAYHYAAYAEQEKERRQRKKKRKPKIKNRKKRNTDPTPNVPHPRAQSHNKLNLYHIVSDRPYEDEEWSSRNNAILFQ
eukprot:156946_1